MKKIEKQVKKKIEPKKKKKKLSALQVPKKIKIDKKKKKLIPIKKSKNLGPISPVPVNKKAELKPSLSREVKPSKEARVTKKIKPLKLEKYYQAIGRRKRAVARIRLFVRGEKVFLVNDKPYNVYFSDSRLQQIAIASLDKMNSLERFRISVKVKGGGIHSQAEAIRHAISRALILLNPNFKKRLRKAGYLTRDPRERERKKFGLKRARRAPQWRKR